MKLSSASGTVLLLALATSLTANPPRQSPSPAKPTENSTERASPSANEGTGKSRIPCKTPENTALCYWTHGRMSFYPQYPPLRIWKIGTERLLGVFSGPSCFPPRNTHQLFLPNLPANLSRIYDDPRNWEPPDDDREPNVSWSDDVFADFEVCPLAPERKGKMQPVCIESAKNILVERDK